MTMDRSTDTVDQPLTQGAGDAILKAASHTPGPWKVWQSHADNSLNVANHAHEFVCEVGRIHGEGYEVEMVRADARLIAAAPDLLEALEIYMAQFGQGLEAHGIAFGPAQRQADELARLAIKKALGTV